MKEKEPETRWFSILAKKDGTTHFIRDVLGCRCPQEVFDHYQVQFQYNKTAKKVQIIMGQKLLVRIVNASSLNSPKKLVTELLEEGLEERDFRKLNRFRLVIIGELTEAMIRELMGISEGIDPKVHLHILPEINGHGPKRGEL